MNEFNFLQKSKIDFGYVPMNTLVNIFNNDYKIKQTKEVECVETISMIEYLQKNVNRK